MEHHKLKNRQTYYPKVGDGVLVITHDLMYDTTGVVVSIKKATGTWEEVDDDGRLVEVPATGNIITVKEDQSEGTTWPPPERIEYSDMDCTVHFDKLEGGKEDRLLAYNRHYSNRQHG